MNITQCRQINDQCNALMEYRTDLEVYGRTDYWATVREMLTDPATQKLMDDCDGSADLKYEKMKEAGCPIKELSMLICIYLPNGTGHMVTGWTENTNDNFDPYILDIPEVEPVVWKLSERSDLKPLYAFNENRLSSR